MKDDVETLIREGAPRVTTQPEAFLAALNVSNEAAQPIRIIRKRSVPKWAAGGAIAVIALGGATGAAVAATQGAWWSAPHDVVAEAEPISDVVAPARSVSCILEAEFAEGVDGSSPEAKAAFQLAQQWLVGHPVVAAVPEEARTLTSDEESGFSKQGWPSQIALNFQAIQATQPALDAAAAANHDALVVAISAYLEDQRSDPALITVADRGGYCEVGH